MFAVTNSEQKIGQKNSKLFHCEQKRDNVIILNGTKKVSCLFAVKQTWLFFVLFNVMTLSFFVHNQQFWPIFLFAISNCEHTSDSNIKTLIFEIFEIKFSRSSIFFISFVKNTYLFQIFNSWLGLLEVTLFGWSMLTMFIGFAFGLKVCTCFTKLLQPCFILILFFFLWTVALWSQRLWSSLVFQS